MNVLVTGGAGYIGGAVLQALRSAGHTPLALAHSDDTIAVIRARGGTPLPGDLRDSPRLAALAARADAVIHAANTNGSDSAEVDAAATRAMLGALAGTGKPLVYTSGVWVLGDTGDHVADETSPLRPASLVAWREGLEAELAHARGVRAVVLRPGIVFGEGGGIPAMIARGELPVVGDGRQRWALVHLRDLADLYVRALGAPPGAVLHGVSASATMRELALLGSARHGRAVAAPPPALPLDAARERFGAFADALALDQVVSSARTRALVGWAPRRPSVVEALLLETRAAAA